MTSSQELVFAKISQPLPVTLPLLQLPQDVQPAVSVSSIAAIDLGQCCGDSHRGSTVLSCCIHLPLQHVCESSDARPAEFLSSGHMCSDIWTTLHSLDADDLVLLSDIL